MNSKTSYHGGLQDNTEILPFTNYSTVLYKMWIPYDHNTFTTFHNTNTKKTCINIIKNLYVQSLTKKWLSSYYIKWKITGRTIICKGGMYTAFFTMLNKYTQYYKLLIMSFTNFLTMNYMYHIHEFVKLDKRVEFMNLFKLLSTVSLKQYWWSWRKFTKYQIDWKFCAVQHNEKSTLTAVHIGWK